MILNILTCQFSISQLVFFIFVQKLAKSILRSMNRFQQKSFKSAIAFQISHIQRCSFLTESGGKLLNF